MFLLKCRQGLGKKFGGMRIAPPKTDYDGGFFKVMGDFHAQWGISECNVDFME